MKIDRIEIIRGGNPFPVSMRNGDKLDSLMSFYSGARLIDFTPNTNTDPSLNWAGKGGILAEGNYRWIFDRRLDNGKAVLFLYCCSDDRDRLIRRAVNLTPNDRTLVSLIPNPAHRGRYIMTNILVHDIGANTDNSQGCITAKDWALKYSNYFSIGDKGRLILSRDTAWREPDEYKRG